ncbi:MAG: dihydrolipoyl dehydrogenase, partial [Elusimicrobia bacterium]|nr:dihydrolipoyl dehydrogenase [Elusimicrobiota bacterium]
MPSRHIVIIGAGPGGYTAAFHAADLGLQVTLIDKNPNPGGICLYQGCIPSKALLHAAKLMTDLRETEAIGITCGEPKVDIEKLRAWKEGVTSRLTSGLGQLTKARKITFIQGTAKFLNSSTIEAQKISGEAVMLSFDKAIIATGSSAVTLPFLPNSPRVWDAADALALPAIPEHLLVIGGGYIGLELGSAYAALGAKVSVVEALPQILSGMDKDLADILLRRLKKTFTKIRTATTVTSVEETGSGLQVTLKDAKGAETKDAYSHILVAVGRRPNTKGLGLENTKVRVTDRGFVAVDPKRQTDDGNILAIGDVTGGPLLAHKAAFEGKIAADAIAGKDVGYEPVGIPGVVFTDPELAWVGLTEQEATTAGQDIAVSKFPWSASGRALTLNRTDGMTKIIADKNTSVVLGVGIVGVGAGDLISEGALAVENKLKVQNLALTIH